MVQINFVRNAYFNEMTLCGKRGESENQRKLHEEIVKCRMTLVLTIVKGHCEASEMKVNTSKVIMKNIMTNKMFACW